MKKILITIIFGLAAALALQAQEVPVTSPVDSTLLGRDILSVMGPGVEVIQSPAVREALESYVRSNGEKPLMGYRIRVFYDNGPQARTRSENIEATLRQQFRAAVYRSFESPNYKVAIGDFRTKDEALRIYNALKGTYPTAYIIKEPINYPR